MTALVSWTGRKELSIAPQKSSVTLFTPDTHQSRYHPQVKIGDALIPLNKNPKILGVKWDTHFTFGPHVRAMKERTNASLRVLKALASTGWGMSQEEAYTELWSAHLGT